MAEEIRLTGQWYIPRTEETLPGTLLIHPVKKQIILQLTALASENDLMAAIRAYGRQELIQGSIDTGGRILLYDCIFGMPHNYIGQRTQVTVTAKAAFWNLTVDSAKELCFQKVAVDFGEIIEWTGLCSFEWEMDEAGERLVWKHEEDIIFPINDNITLRISPCPGSHQMWSFRKEFTVKQSVYLFLEYQNDTHWEKILKDVRIIQNLIILGMGRRIFIESIDYYHLSHTHSADPEYIREMPVYLGDEQDGVTTAGRGTYFYLFSLGDLTRNGCKSLRLWYDKYERLKPVIELYEAAWNVPGISAEMLFLNLAQALETYHARFVCDDFKQYVDLVDDLLRTVHELAPDAEFSEHVKKQRKIMINQDLERSKRIVLKSRLGYLFCARFVFIFSYLHYRMTDFIDRMVYTRNYYTHYSPDKEKLIFPSEELPYINGLLMAVLQYYIMNEIEISTDIIEEKVRRQIAGVMDSYHLMGPDALQT